MNVVDRRTSGKNNSIGNRDKFIKRFKEHIRKAVKGAVKHRDIKDIEQKTKVRIPQKDLNEPSFGFEKDGTWERVLPGNEEYNRGDKLKRPDEGRGGMGKGASDSDETGEDDFQFELSREEFMQIFFEDLELPNLTKESLQVITKFKNIRAGYKKDGVPSNLNVLKSLRCAIGRRIALGAKTKKEIEKLFLEHEKEIDIDSQDYSEESLEEFQKKLKELDNKLAKIPFIDPIDLRYSNRVKVPNPSKNAVMFCLMDVSGSMGDHEKDIAKRFYMLLHLFLTKSYDTIDIVFIKHHTQAFEVDEQDFFYSQETGGTVVHTALDLTKKIISERYPLHDWNIYVAQCSDGDSMWADAHHCKEMLLKDFLPICQFYTYIEIATQPQYLWKEYLKIEEENFSMGKVNDITEIYPVFRKFFEKVNHG